MRTDLPPLGEAQRRSILDAIIEEGDAAESLGLEIKSDVDPSRKGLGLAKVAKCILGMANRMPQDAQRFFGGYGVLVLGAGKGATPGVPAGIEQHDLANRHRPYLGDPGPRWDLSRLGTQDGNDVLFIIIEPAAMGDPIYPCRKEYQPDSGDKKSNLADGDVYVRDTTSTRKARAHQIDALVTRAQGSGGPRLNLAVAVHGEALAVADTDSAIRDLIQHEGQSMREDLARDERGQILPWAATYDVLGRTSRVNPEDIDAAVRSAELQWWRRWPTCRDTLFGAVGPPVSFTLENSELLHGPEIIIRIRAARGLPVEDSEGLASHEVIPTIDPPHVVVPRLNPRSFRRDIETDWENIGDDLVITLTPKHLRPNSPWTSERDEFVVVSLDPEATQLDLEWSLTATNLSDRHDGHAQLPAKRVLDLRELFQQWREVTTEPVESSLSPARHPCHAASGFAADPCTVRTLAVPQASMSIP